MSIKKSRTTLQESTPNIPAKAGASEGDFAKNAAHHLNLCRDIILSQESLNREFSRKALGVITFSVTLFGFGVRWAASDHSSATISVLVVALGVCAVVIAFIGIAFVIKPGDWGEARRLSYFQKVARGANHNAYLATLVDTYKKASEDNGVTLEARGKNLKVICWLALFQLVLFAVLGFVV